MKKIQEFLKSLPHVLNPELYGIYPDSLNRIDESFVFMVKEPDQDFLIVYGKHSSDFKGDMMKVDNFIYLKAPLIHENASALRLLFPFTKPIPVLDKKRSFGLGDRLGIAGPGHIRVFKHYDAYPVFVQQSIRELSLTHRTYEQVLDSATFFVYRDGYKDGFGADGDHLKKSEDIEYALNLGYTMITLDCSDYIRNDVSLMHAKDVDEACTLSEELKDRYLKKTFQIEDIEIEFDEEELKRNVLVYAKAIDYAVEIYQKYLANGKSKANFELSIDETATPTSPAQHYFVASELTRKGVHLDTMAPRFCGEFQKGVDYVGDLAQFEVELKTHAAIARHYGYKLSIHSGSDKFSIFSLVGKYTRGNFHVKTAGTNWLEAMRLVATYDPTLYKEIHKYALSMFDEATKFYHVTTDLTQIPDVDNLTDKELAHLFNQNDARQLIHITYGYILNAQSEDGSFLYKDRLYKLWREKADAYSDMLYNHINKHLELLYAGFDQ